MRAVVLEQHGGPEVLTRRDVPDPVPGPEEVVVAVTATAVNRADLLQRMGLYPGPPMPFEIPGLEFAGRVVALGDRAREAAVGDEVMGIVGGGAYAELLAVHERQLLRVPPALGLADAAAVPEGFITAWDALVLQGGLTQGRVALVHAGASGVGTAAIQVASALGATVVVTASAGKLEACRRLGADLAVERSPADWLGAVLDAFPGGVDVVLDVVGGDELQRNVAALAVQGRIVQVGVMGGGQATFSLGTLLPKRATITGTVLRARPIEEKIAVTRRFAREVLPLFAAGRLRPVIDSRFPLDEVAAAHERMEANANVGKILLDVG
ncbi:MAG: NAD(P)H-quinone oxidoreductase [Acidimicrobiales bacterium]|nr:NAD(P)H-quinone oxidoreductase [Acidimicrobiales bacterium]